MDDRRPGSGSGDCRDVGNAEAIRLHLNALLDNHHGRPLCLSVAQIAAQQHLRTAVIPFTHVSLQEFAVDIVAVRPVNGIQVFVDGNRGGGRH